MKQTANHFRKDESLDWLAERMNVAQFVSFSPGGGITQEYARVLGYPPNHRFRDLHNAIGELLQRSSDKAVNVRSFRPDDPQGHEFIYGLKSIDDTVSATRRIIGDGLHVIVNETIDISDGGVSGVCLGDVIEFAPDDTPRSVEKPGVASLTRDWGLRILETVYGFKPAIDLNPKYRVEFSVHPKPRGWKHGHTLGWELQEVGETSVSASLAWPNRFSRVLGDKVYGLLIADAIGLPVPRTTVINRRIAPFTFGRDTGTAEYWLRTCPVEQIPGLFTTHRGWIDPFTLMSREDPSGDKIPSVVAQAGVGPLYSGAAIVQSDYKLIVEGRSGEGEVLMKGSAGPERLPEYIIDDVEKLYWKAWKKIGPARFEWVHDGDEIWVVQLHRGITQTLGSILVPGEAVKWHHFRVEEGLEALRSKLGEMANGEGIIIIGTVGVTSHIADVVRKAGIPARLD